jgi:hypothetical protein
MKAKTHNNINPQKWLLKEATRELSYCKRGRRKRVVG